MVFGKVSRRANGDNEFVEVCVAARVKIVERAQDTRQIIREGVWVQNTTAVGGLGACGGRREERYARHKP